MSDALKLINAKLCNLGRLLILSCDIMAITTISPIQLYMKWFKLLMLGILVDIFSLDSYVGIVVHYCSKVVP